MFDVLTGPRYDYTYGVYVEKRPFKFEISCLLQLRLKSFFKSAIFVMLELSAEIINSLYMDRQSYAVNFEFENYSILFNGISISFVVNGSIDWLIESRKSPSFYMCSRSSSVCLLRLRQCPSII